MRHDGNNKPNQVHQGEETKINGDDLVTASEKQTIQLPW